MFHRFCLGLVIICLLFSCSNAQKEESSERLIQVSNSKATVEAKNLYTYIQSQNGILIGHQDDVAYGVGWKEQCFESDIHKVTGKYPAVFGWDLGHIHDTINIDSVSFNNMIEWAKEVHKRGAINTYGWHALNFRTGDSSWDITPCISDILPGGELNNKFVISLNLIADFFDQLVDSQGNKIPLVFRPWHEMNGGWFWWGSKSCTSDEYKQLFRYTVDYLRYSRNLNNILFCYSPDVFETREEYLEFYPGDAYVDFLGVDDYKGVKNRKTISKTINRLEILDELALEKNKLFILSETGQEGITNQNWFTEILLPTLTANERTKNTSWVLIWRNYSKDHHYAPYPGHPSARDFKKFAEHDLMLFMNDLKR